ncbi:hypothetical protein AAG906_020847 [Vitis piasezkii]
MDASPLICKRPLLPTRLLDPAGEKGEKDSGLIEIIMTARSRESKEKSKTAMMKADFISTFRTVIFPKNLLSAESVDNVLKEHLHHPSGFFLRRSAETECFYFHAAAVTSSGSSTTAVQTSSSLVVAPSVPTSTAVAVTSSGSSTTAVQTSSSLVVAPSRGKKTTGLKTLEGNQSTEPKNLFVVQLKELLNRCDDKLEVINYQMETLFVQQFLVEEPDEPVIDEEEDAARNFW